MSQILRHKGRKGGGKSIAADGDPLLIDFGRGATLPLVHFANGLVAEGSCVRCAEPLCIWYFERPSSSPSGVHLAEFPADTTSTVCPTGAIRWPTDAPRPEIDEQLCVGCGLCAARCTFGAIYLRDDGVAILNDQPNDAFRLDPAAGPPKIVKEPTRKGTIADERSAVLVNLPSRIQEAGSTVDPNLLTRNLLRQVGLSCEIRRRGDVNVRMDGLFVTVKQQPGVFEVEFGTAALESPRALLEDIAVLVSRYGLRSTEVVPLSILLTLPNARSEYYRVIDDIREVLKVRIRTLTVGALCIIVWNFASISEFPDGLFETTAQRPDITPGMAKILGRNVKHPEPHPGCFRNWK